MQASEVSSMPQQQFRTGRRAGGRLLAAATGLLLLVVSSSAASITTASSSGSSRVPSTARAGSTTAAFMGGGGGAGLWARGRRLLWPSSSSAAMPSRPADLTAPAPASCGSLLPLPLATRGGTFVQRSSQRLMALTLPDFAAYSANLGAGLGTNTALALLGIVVKQRWLTQAGLFHAWILGVTLWSTLGWTGWALCVLYLVFGSLVTKVKQREKEALGIAEKRGGARGPENVWGSAAAGTMCAVASLFLPSLLPLLKIGYVASLATKLSDTFASEIGKAYGKRTYLITTLKPVPPGTEGAVSLEGTLAGVAGSVLMAVPGILLGLIGWGSLPLTLVAAFVATNVESLLGASLQNDKYPWATNEFINFLNTLIGAAIAMAVATLMGGGGEVALGK